ncbi:hypothetical protein [Deinococcus kurensis]|uniref:hypothetical protein n=1 Tax=Deinococcus kurensis TaxID=2662757 RepID=UPI0012D36EDC|nr:hypothetical protein [Deinococcus kurensis]
MNIDILSSYGYVYQHPNRLTANVVTAYAVGLDAPAWAVVIVEDHALRDGTTTPTGQFLESWTTLDGDERDAIFGVLRDLPRSSPRTVPFDGDALRRANLTIQFQAGLAARRQAQRPLHVYLSAHQQADGVWMGAITETGYQLLSTVAQRATLPPTDAALEALMAPVSGQALADAVKAHIDLPFHAVNAALRRNAQHRAASDRATKAAQARADDFYQSMTQGW